MTLIRPVAGRRVRYHVHPVGDVARTERAAGEWEYGLVVRAVLMAPLLLGLLFGVPLAFGALAVALGMDPLAGAR